MIRSMERIKLAIAVAAAGLLLSSAAHADMVGNKLYDSTMLVTQSHIDLQTLNITGAGTLSVKLTDLKWPDLLGTLSFTVFDATHVLGSYSLDNSLATSGIGTFNVNTAGTYYASIFATPATGKSGGLYNAQIYFQTTAPVPLPAAAWLMISGLACFAAVRPKQSASQKLSQLPA